MRASVTSAGRSELRLASLQLNLSNSFKDVNLRYLERLRDLAEAPVGYSGHERGIEVPIAAVALGAAVIEKHITLDRGMEGNDLGEPPAWWLPRCSGIRRVEESMGQGGERSISQGEMMNREVLAKTPRSSL